MDCRMSWRADPNIVGIMITGCFLHVQNDFWKILSKKILFRPNRAFLAIYATPELTMAVSCSARSMSASTCEW